MLPNDPFCREVSFKVEIHFRQTKTNPTFDRSIHLLEKLTSILSKRTVKWLKLFAPLSWNMNYLSQLSGGSNHPIPPFPSHPSIHRSTEATSVVRWKAWRVKVASKSRSCDGVPSSSDVFVVGRVVGDRGRPFGEVVGGPGTRSFPILGRFWFFF